MFLDCFKLVQESETRFSTFYQVAEQFLKSYHHIEEMPEQGTGSSAQSANGILKKTPKIDRIITGYPAIEAILMDLRL